MTGRRFALALASLLALGVFVTCTLPTQTKHAMHTQGRFHPWIHVFTFALLACLFVSSLRSNALRCLSVAALLLLGYLTEARESRWNHWPIEEKDVRSDAAGVLLGSVLGIALASTGRLSRTATSQTATSQTAGPPD